MKLHEDKDAFGVLLNSVSEKTGIRFDILEKDYYLTLLLEELAEKQEHVPAYFKGGTALYKAIGSMKRFSEDIDLTVEIKDCSTSQGKKRLEISANSYTSLHRTEDKAKEENRKGSITSVYEYEPMGEYDKQDILQRFGYVKIEATSFTISEPYETLQIEPLIYSQSSDEQKTILQESYEMCPFQIKTIKMERIFADKLLAAEFYYQRKQLFDVCKHLYDISLMLEQDRIQKMIQDKTKLIEMLSLKRLEERERKGSDLSTKPFNEFILFENIKNDGELQKTFQKMQNIYVFDDKDKMEYGELIQKMERLYNALLSLDEGLVLNQEEDFTMKMY